MILNNLDPCVAQFPQELVTYGGNGQVFSNWAQVKYYAFLKQKEQIQKYSKCNAFFFFLFNLTKMYECYEQKRDVVVFLYLFFCFFLFF